MSNKYKLPFQILLLTFLFLGHEKGFAITYPKEGSFYPITEVPVHRPDYLKSYIDPLLSNKVTRVTDSAVFGMTNPRHDYSKTQTWSCDGRFIRIKNRLLDGTNYHIIRTIPFLDEAKWSSVNPHIIYGFYGKNRFAKLSILNDKVTILHQFKDYDEVRMGPWEGNLSWNDQYVVFSARKKLDLIVILYNIKQNKIEKKRIFPKAWKQLDWVSISPSGKYILFNWKPSPSAKDQVIDCYRKEITFLHRLTNQGCHGDMGYNTQGKEVYVQFEFGKHRGIWMYQLDTAMRTQILPDKYNGGHLSCRNIKRPGWAYMSCNKKGFREVFAVKLDGSGTVNRFAKHHSSFKAPSYISESQASPSPDGSKVIFASDWTGESEVNSYIVESADQKPSSQSTNK